jgi:hypothetical protein
VIRRATALALLVPFAAVALAAPASAATVTVTNDGGCYNVAYGEKRVLPNGLCYLGPELPPLD